MQKNLLIAWTATTVVGLLGLVCRADAPASANDAGYKVTGTLHVGGEGRWDLLAVDPVAKLVYVPRSTHTQIIREATGEVVGDLKDTPGVHGVALAPELGRGFTSNGKAGTVTIFDLKSMAALGTTKVGDNPDAILYDPGSKKVFVFNGKSQDATVLDAAAAPGAAALATIPLGGKPELPVIDDAGHLYVNLEDTSSVSVIDTAAQKVSGVWKLKGGEQPSGLAIDVKGHRLFAGCGGNNVMVIVDTRTGETLATLPIGPGVDGCGFDPVTDCAFASCGGGAGTLTVVKETSPGKFEVVQNLTTRAGARTLVVDPMTHAIYLATAEMNEAKPGEKRPTPKPDSFMLVVVSPQAK